MNRCTKTNEVWSSKISWIYARVLFESFCLTNLLSTARVRSFEIMLGQILNH
jgi:hypothetical protein